MAITRTEEHTPWGTLVLFSQTSAADTALTCSTDGLMPYKILFATMDCSSTGTATCTYTLNSALGAAFDALLESDATAVVQTFLPTYELLLRTGDALDVLVGAAGATFTTSAVIYCLMLDDD